VKVKINKITYDTDSSMNLGRKYVGEFGQPDGYEEQLFATNTVQLFFYGIGGPDSPYAEPTIKKATTKEVEAWKNENNN